MSVFNKQQGVGLVEVLVALVLLSIGILGFVALQVRAMDASNEATNRTMAINLARDLAERIRVNRSSFSDYKTAVNTKKTASGCLSSKSISYIPNCDTKKMAEFDSAEITAKAQSIGQSIRIDNCIGSSLNCIYVAWAETDISNSIDQCVSATGAYVENSKCIVMEAF